MLIAALALLLAQEPIDVLIRQLSGGGIEDRERAVVELALRGEAARGALERAAAGKDSETAARARTALARLPLVAAVTPNTEAAFPGLRGRLAAGIAATELPRTLLRASETLRREDLLPIARPALELASENADRAALLGRIAERRLDSAVPAFAALLDIQDWAVRQALFDAIDACHARALIPELLRRLGTPHHDRWIWATPLARLGCRELIPIVLAEILTPTGQNGPGLGPLLELDAVEAGPALIRRALEVDAYQHHNTGGFAQALDRLVPELLRPALHAALEDPNPDRQRRAWTMLVDGLHSRTALPLLRKRLGAPDPRARADAAVKLGHFRRTEFIPELRNALEDESPSVRRAAALALARMGRKDGVVEILPLLDVPQHRLSAAAALVQLGGREYQPALLRTALGPKPEHEDRNWLASHLAGMEAVEVRPLIHELLDSSDEMARRVSTWSLTRLDGVKALPRLRQLMKDPDQNVAWSAFHDMTRLLPADAILDDVRAWARAEDVHTRSQAVDALLRLRRQEAIPLLLRDLSAPESHMRARTAWSCGFHGVTEAIPRLKELLRDRDVRQAAGGALLRLGQREGVPYAANDQNALNLVRRPALRERKLSGPPIVGFNAFIERTGLKVEGEDDAMRAEEQAVEVDGRDLLSVFLACAPPGAVLEEDCVRLLNPREAWRFWKRWAAEEKLLPDPERALAELNEPREVPPLQDGAATRLFLQSKNPALAAAALRGAVSPEEIVQVLGAGGQRPGVREQLPPLLKHPAVGVRLAAARALLLTDGAAGVPLVVPLLDDPAAQTEIVKLLGSLERREANLEIVKRMDTPAVMWGLAWAAGQLKLKEAMPALLMAIQPGEYYFGRMSAVSQIRQLGDPSLAPKLRDALRIETDPQVCSELLRTLGYWGAREAVPEVVDVLKNPRVMHGHYAGQAIQTLDQLGAKEVGLLRDLLKNPAVAETAARTLADWGDVESLPELRKIATASDALGLIGDRASVPLLRERLNDENHMVAWAAAKALAMLGDRESFGRILASEATYAWPLLRTKEAWEKLASKGGEIGSTSPEYLPALRPWLSHEHESLRASATRAVGALDGEEALALTRSMLKDPAPYVRRAAADALHRRALAEGEPGTAFLTNAPRRPAEWGRLRATRFEAAYYGRASELVARVAAAAGLRLEDLPEDSPVGPAYRNVHVRLRAHELPMSGAEVLERLSLQGLWHIILEENRMKVERR